MPLRYALVGDGKTDRVLRHVVDWTFRANEPGIELAEPTLHSRGGKDLAEFVRRVRDKHLPDVIFVHRDAEGATHEARVAEIAMASPTALPVVPVRMTEAWLLIDESALRRASDNPSGTVRVSLPPVGRLESIAGPKTLLHDLMRTASEVQGPRRRRRFEVGIGDRVERLGALIPDYSPLRGLSAFRDLEERIRAVLRAPPRKGVGGA